MNNKYQAKQCYWDVRNQCMASDMQEVYGTRAALGRNYRKYFIHFDSMHEMKVYQLLLRYLPSENIGLQMPIQVIPPSICYPNGKLWKCDFVVYGDATAKTVSWLIEAKGAWLRTFADTLSNLERNQKQYFDKLDIIFPRIIPKNMVVNRLNSSRHKGCASTLKEYETMLSLRLSKKHG